jgi:uncharacterized protein YebE (UPF0316 family)
MKAIEAARLAKNFNPLETILSKIKENASLGKTEVEVIIQKDCNILQSLQGLGYKVTNIKQHFPEREETITINW